MANKTSYIKSLGMIYLLSTCTIDATVSMECDSIDGHRIENTVNKSLKKAASVAINYINEARRDAYNPDGVIMWTDNFLERSLRYLKHKRGKDDSQLLIDLDDRIKYEKRPLDEHTESAKYFFETTHELKIDGARIEINGDLINKTDTEKCKFLLGYLTIALLKTYSYGDRILCRDFRDGFSWNLFEAICYAWYAHSKSTLKEAISLAEEIHLLNKVLSCAQRIDERLVSQEAEAMTRYASDLKANYLGSRTSIERRQECQLELMTLGFIGYDIHRYKKLEKTNETVLDDTMKHWNLYVDAKRLGNENLKKYDSVDDLRKFLSQNESVANDFHLFINPYLDGKHSRKIFDQKIKNLKESAKLPHKIREQNIQNDNVVKKILTHNGVKVEVNEAVARHFNTTAADLVAKFKEMKTGRGKDRAFNTYINVAKQIKQQADN